MTSRTLPISCRRCAIDCSPTARRSSMSRRSTPNTSPAPGSTLRGTPMSTISSARPLRRSMAASITPSPPRTSEVLRTPAAGRTRSAVRVSWWIERPSMRAASASAVDAVRFATTISPTPAPASASAALWPIAPAPTTSTRRSSSDPRRLAASVTAAVDTDTGVPPNPGLIGARLPTLTRFGTCVSTTCGRACGRFGDTHALRLRTEDLAFTDDHRIESRSQHCTGATTASSPFVET